MNDTTIIIIFIIGCVSLQATILGGLMFNFNGKVVESQAMLQASNLELHRNMQNIQKLHEENHREAMAILKEIRKDRRENAIYLRAILERVETKKGFENEENGS